MARSNLDQEESGERTQRINHNTQILKIRYEKGIVTTNSNEILKYFENLHSNKC